MSKMDCFKYNAPHGRQIAIYQELRKKAGELCYYIERHCPNNEDRDVAIVKLRETVMWANSSIANEEVFQTTDE